MTMRILDHRLKFEPNIRGIKSVLLHLLSVLRIEHNPTLTWDGTCTIVEWNCEGFFNEITMDLFGIESDET